jgi:hypothetical protein
MFTSNLTGGGAAHQEDILGAVSGPAPGANGVPPAADPAAGSAPVPEADGRPGGSGRAARVKVPRPAKSQPPPYLKAGHRVRFNCESEPAGGWTGSVTENRRYRAIVRSDGNGVEASWAKKDLVEEDGTPLRDDARQ